MKTIEELQTQINELQKELDNLKTPPSYKRRRAEKKEKYYCLSGNGELDYNIDVNDEIDNFLYNYGDYYKTKEEAEQVRDRQLAIVRVNDRIDELNQGWEHNNKGKRYYIYYYNGYKVYYLSSDNHIRDNIIKLCKTEEIAKQIISEMKDDLDLIFNIK